jgi:hypothetical protein
MSFRTMAGRFVVEFSSAYMFVKLGRWEVFADFERDGGPAGHRISFSREAR